MFDVSIGELLIISLFFITASNCALTYFCCTKSLKVLENDKSVSKAIKKLRVMDQYVLSKINLIVALFYFGLSYFFVDSKIIDSNFVFFFSCILSFPLTLITIFASRVCYCYTCNVLLETKLNEFECLVLNFKRLLVVYFPFTIISLVVPIVYLFNLDRTIKIILCIGILLGILFIWIILTPKIMVLNYKAKKIENNTLLRHRLENLMKRHNIKYYELYCWDSSRSKEVNAMVSGIRKYHLFISTSLIEELTLPELETVITHEIGHIKNRHLLKIFIGKLFAVISLVVLAIAPYIFDVDKVRFYFIAGIAVFIGVVISVAIERSYESQADIYATIYNDPELFSSALKKISKYEDEETNKIDVLFQSHPDVKNRIEKVKKGKK